MVNYGIIAFYVLLGSFAWRRGWAINSWNAIKGFVKAILSGGVPKRGTTGKPDYARIEALERELGIAQSPGRLHEVHPVPKDVMAESGKGLISVDTGQEIVFAPAAEPDGFEDIRGWGSPAPIRRIYYPHRYRTDPAEDDS